MYLNVSKRHEHEMLKRGRFGKWGLPLINLLSGHDMMGHDRTDWAWVGFVCSIHSHSELESEAESETWKERESVNVCLYIPTSVL